MKLHGDSITHEFVKIALFFIFLFIVMPPVYFWGDMLYWKWWGTYMLEHGFANVYREPNINYHPVFLYFLYLFSVIQGSAEAIEHNIHYVKIIPLIFDFAAVYAFWLLYKKYDFPFKSIWFLLLNIAYLYNSLIWMQVDSIHSTLLLFAIIFVLLGNPAVCIIFLILALNTKLQSIILLPVIGLLLLKYFRNRKAVFRMVASLIITQAIIILPFLINGTTHLYYRVITGAVDFFPKVSMNAFNMWYWITNSDPMEIDDFNPWMGLTYKLWGLIFFMIAGAIALLPLIAKTVYRLLYKLSFDKQYLEQMFLTSALCIIIFFFFNTQMHERYVHPAIVLLFGYSVLRKNYLLYVICSVAYFLNLECINQYLKIRHVTPYFDARYIAALYLFIIVAATWRLYRRYDLVHDIQLIRSRMFTKYAA